MNRDLAAARPALLRFARVQVRDEHLAEDMVQDTLAAAIGKRSQFRSEAQLKTWLIGILKNKITDHFRNNRTAPERWQDENAALEHLHHDSFNARGHWLRDDAPRQWNAAPETFAEQQAFKRVLEQCLRGLPEDTARIFYLREIIGCDVAEICAMFGISRENCYVVLHRARNGLRTCLQLRWFDGER